jgi:hypothetical protein
VKAGAGSGWGLGKGGKRIRARELLVWLRAFPFFYYAGF